MEAGISPRIADDIQHEDAHPVMIRVAQQQGVGGGSPNSTEGERQERKAERLLKEMMALQTAQAQAANHNPRTMEAAAAKAGALRTKEFSAEFADSHAAHGSIKEGLGPFPASRQQSLREDARYTV